VQVIWDRNGPAFTAHSDDLKGDDHCRCTATERSSRKRLQSE
jgi:hypothetical protein